MNLPPIRASLKHIFVTGFLIVAPISITVFLLITFISLLDKFFAPIVWAFVGQNLPGIGLAMAIAIIFAAGFLGTNIAGHHFVEVFEDILLRIPLFNWLYRTVKQLTDVFNPESGVRFESVVMVEYPREGVWSLGFITKKIKFQPKDGPEQTLFSVYIATNHAYIGDVILVPEHKLVRTQLNLQEGLQCLLSAGASIPEALKQIDAPKTDA